MNFRKIGLAAASVIAAIGLSSNVSAFSIDEHVEGYWVERDVQGNRGWGFQYLPLSPEYGVFFVAGFIYDADGNAHWAVGQAEVMDGMWEVDIPLQTFAGGTPGPDAGTPAVDDGDFANLNIEFHTCNAATFTFSGELDYTSEMIRFWVGEVPSDRCPWQQEFTACPSFSTPAAFDRTCVLSGTYNDDIRLTNNTLWVLSGGVFIGDKADIGDPVPEDGPTITIEGGTRIVGSGGADALIISRGSRIIAEGMPNAPIVMTGSKTFNEGASSGDWGGLVINGAAPLNTCDSGVCEALGEGDSGAYGGDDPYDSSGSIKYLRVQNAGNKITDEDELNGIAFQGVGSGTTVDHVQVHRNADDGIEFFGGTVNATHLVLTHIEDDSLDWTQGYDGNLQYVIIQQIQDETVDTDRGMELDNLEQNNDAAPRSTARMANFTLVGKAGELGINPRRGTGGNFSNFVVTGFDKCLDVDSAATFAAAGTPESPTGVLTFENMILDCATPIVENDETDENDQPVQDPYSMTDFVNAMSGNSYEDPNLDGIVPPAGAEYLSGYPLDMMVFDPDVFDMTDYKGAVRDANSESAWFRGWTVFLDD
jgi:hypothetical protein